MNSETGTLTVTSVRPLHKILSVKFPKVEEQADQDGLFVYERRVINDELIKNNQDKAQKIIKYLKMFFLIPPFIENFIIKILKKVLK